MMALLGLQIGVSMESPPRISACRLVFKAKPNDSGSAWTETYTFSQGGKCQKLRVKNLELDFVQSFANYDSQFRTI